MKKIFIPIILVLILVIVGIVLFLNKDDSSNIIELTYKTNGGVPYNWEYEIEDEAIVKFVKSYVIEDKNKNGLVGAPIYTNYVFEGVNDGVTTVTFKYVSINGEVDRVEKNKMKVSNGKISLVVGDIDMGNTLDKQEKNNYVSYNGKLKVDGVNLVNQYGEKIILKGVSSHGLQWFNNLITDSNIKTLKSWGSNVFRLAMYTKEGGYIDNKSIYDTLVNDVDMIIKNDMYVIIDWHILSDNNPNTHVNEAKEFFDKISLKYKDTPNVIFEICNEPNGSTNWYDVKSYADQVIPVIRKNSDAVILVGTPNWSQDVDSVIGNKLEYSNIMYSLHFYTGTHKEYLRDKATKAISNGIPVFVSEWGVSDASGNGGVYLDEADVWMKYLNDNNISYINWSLSDKNESSALLLPNSSVINDNTLSESGKYIKELLSK